MVPLLENVKTWRFDNPYAAERKYETTFEYRLTEDQMSSVCLESFHKVKVVTGEGPTISN
jgi:hypothetical protein